MNVERLIVCEWPARTPLSEIQFQHEFGFNVETCQRSLTISFLNVSQFPTAARRIFTGSDAYAFLLRFACGLESAVLGETDVFGQFKNSWKDFQRHHEHSPLNQIIQRVLEDSKEIRSLYLQNIGSGNYGSHARKLLKPNPNQKVLCIGAGAMAQAIAPYFGETELTIWNRTFDRSHILADKLVRKEYSRPEVLDCEFHQIDFAKFDSILVLIPNTDFIAETLSNAKPSQKILHGGCSKKDLPIKIQTMENLFTLDDIFALDQSSQSSRKDAVDRALNAIRDRSLLRSLGRNISISHGWEDLALFIQ